MDKNDLLIPIFKYFDYIYLSWLWVWIILFVGRNLLCIGFLLSMSFTICGESLMKLFIFDVNNLQVFSIQIL